MNTKSSPVSIIGWNGGYEYIYKDRLCWVYNKEHDLNVWAWGHKNKIELNKFGCIGERDLDI